MKTSVTSASVSGSVFRSSLGLREIAGRLILGGVVLGASVVVVEGADLPKASVPPPPVRPASAEFERLKSLAGTWKGTADLGQGPVELVSQYRVIAAGSAVEEKVFVGTPNEMTTLYYDNREGRLALTHFCVFGNRPGMVLASSDPKTLRFAFDTTCGIDAAKEAHMHSLTLTWVDADTLTASCKALVEGRELPECPTTMKRVSKP